MLLADYDLDVRYKPGKQNGLADFLSRYVPSEEDKLDDVVANNIGTLNSLVEIDLVAKQREDDDLKSVIDKLSIPNPRCKEYLKLVQKYIIRDGLLLRKVKVERIDKHVIVLVPTELQSTLLKEFHDSPMEGGHLNEVKTLHKLRERFYWKNMPKDVHQHIKTCDPCQKRKVPPSKPLGFLQKVPHPSLPFQKILLDVIGTITPPSNKYKYILTISDSYSRMAFAYCLKTADAKSISDCLLKLFYIFGVPSVIVTDRGTEFKNNLLTCLDVALGYSHIYASAYSPHVVGEVERFNGVLSSIISHYVHSKPNKWSGYVSQAVFCYNNSVHHVLKLQKPSFLFFGYDVNLPSDTILALPQCEKTMLDRLRVMQEVRDTLPHLLAKKHARQAKYYDRNKKDKDFEPGSEVLVYYPYTLRTPLSKYSQRYKGPYTVLHKISPVSYMVEILKKWKVNARKHSCEPYETAL